MPFSLDVFHHGGFVQAFSHDIIRLGTGRKPLRRRGQATAQFHGIERFGLETIDRFLPADDEGQGGRHDAPDIQGGVIQKGIQPAGIDAHQPIRLGTAQGSVVQTVVIGIVPHIPEPLPDGFFLHGRNPQTLNRLMAPSLIVHQPEDQFAFPPGVCGADDGFHVLPVHEALQGFKLLPGGV